MTRRNASLKPQLNQIRSWVQEGATDIWIAHKLGSTPASISRFRRQHDLRRSDEPAGPAVDYVVDDDLEAVAPAAKPAAPKRARREPRTARPAASDAGATVAAPAAPEDAAPATDDGEGEPAKRRRGRRGGRGRSKGAADGPIELEAVFDHGDEGYGLWLDGAVREAGVYRNHWQGHADIVVRITADEIVIRRAGEAPPNRS